MRTVFCTSWRPHLREVRLLICRVLGRRNVRLKSRKPLPAVKDMPKSSLDSPHCFCDGLRASSRISSSPLGTTVCSLQHPLIVRFLQERETTRYKKQRERGNDVQTRTVCVRNTAIIFRQFGHGGPSRGRRPAGQWQTRPPFP